MSVVVVGNPKPMSRTRAAAELIVERLTGQPATHVIDVIDLGPALFGWGDPAVADAVKLVNTYESGIYGNTHLRSTHGYEQRRDAAPDRRGGPEPLS